MSASTWPALTLQVWGERGPLVIDLLQLKEECRTSGRLAEAQDIQLQLEFLKSEEEARRMTSLSEQQVQQAGALEREKVAEYEAFTAFWDTSMLELRSRGQVQVDALDSRHAMEVEDHRRRVQAAEPKPRWGPTLLHLRRSQEALVQQNEFRKADQLRSRGDALEEEEYKSHFLTWQHKVQLDEAKLEDKQVRESEALRKKLSMMENEALIHQDRLLEKLMKKYQASKSALHRIHSQEVVGMSTALRGWINPRKLGVGCYSMPTTPSRALSPGVRASSSSVSRRRPVTAFDMPRISLHSLTGVSQSVDSARDDDRRSAYEGSHRAQNSHPPLMNPLLPKRGGLVASSVLDVDSDYDVTATVDDGGGGGGGGEDSDFSPTRELNSPRQTRLSAAGATDLASPGTVATPWFLAPLHAPPSGANGRPPAVQGVPYAVGVGPGATALRGAASVTSPRGTPGGFMRPPAGSWAAGGDGSTSFRAIAAGSLSSPGGVGRTSLSAANSRQMSSSSHSSSGIPSQKDAPLMGRSMR